MKSIPVGSYGVLRCICSRNAPAFEADLCSVVCSAIQYALGRHTYMPGIVSEFTQRHIPQMEDAVLIRAVELIRNHLNDESQDPHATVWYSLLHTMSGWIREKSSRSDAAMMTLPKIETLERIDRYHLAEHLDELLERVEKEDIAFVITSEGKDDLVLCPGSWFNPMIEDEFGCVINSAIRHALRSEDSESAGVIRFVHQNYKLFDERTLSVAISDIERDLDYPLFLVKDPAAWVKLKNLLSAQLEVFKKLRAWERIEIDGEER